MNARRLTIRQWLVAAAWLLGGAVVLIAIVAVLGLYNVAASRGHAPWVDLFLRFGMRRSVAFHSIGVEAPALDSSDLIRLGAAHYHTGCGNCHGFPGDAGNPIYNEMLPVAPDLAEAMAEWSAEEAFWVVRHGLKYTGMPAWAGQGRDDEVWAMVAFLTQLPRLDAAEYLSLADGNAMPAASPVDALPRSGAGGLRQTACARCHDTADAPPVSAYVPSLGGQSATYIRASLEAYRAGTRESGMMEPVAHELSDREIEELAAHYASLESPSRPARGDDGALERGRRLAVEGDSTRDVPACETCHAPGRLPLYPTLDGLPVAYQSAQLELWQGGGRAGTEAGRTMAVIADRLSAAQIDDVSAFYAGIERGAGDRGAVIGPGGGEPE